MTARRLFCAVALMIVSVGTGCQSWCSRHYPCQQPAYGGYAPAAPVACVPCCPPTSGYPAAPAPAPAWNAPRTVGGAACVPCQ